jgi:hypothetical protein
MACDELLRLDVRSMSHRAGVDFRKQPGGSALDVPFFDEIITMTVPGFTFKSSRTATVSLVAKIIILHYLIKASGELVPDDHVSYEDIPGARHYLPVFEKRVTKPLASAFGYNRDAFLESGVAMGGKAEEYGNASFTLLVLPRVPITFILWEGDEEFSPSVRTLFNPTISGYLPLEDIVVVSKLAATRIIRVARMRHSEEVME